RLQTDENVSLHTALLVTLRGPWGGEILVRATVVAVLADGIALAVEGDPDEILARLLFRPSVAVETEPEEVERPETTQNTWDRMRSLSQMEKILLAVKADRTERAFLLQDNDPRVLLSIQIGRASCRKRAERSARR